MAQYTVSDYDDAALNVLVLNFAKEFIADKSFREALKRRLEDLERRKKTLSYSFSECLLVSGVTWDSEVESRMGHQYVDKVLWSERAREFESDLYCLLMVGRDYVAHHHDFHRRFDWWTRAHPQAKTPVRREPYGAYQLMEHLAPGIVGILVAAFEELRRKDKRASITAVLQKRHSIPH